jgi:cell division protein ZapE
MGPVDSLKQAVAEGRLQPDPGQAEIAQHLQALCEALAEWNEGKSSFFSKSKPAPKGMYLYGGVGTGKSLMMDLFFDAAPVSKKRRVHFHQFLQEIQARITHEREKKDSDPLPRVAKALAKQTRLLCFDELQVTDVGDAMILGRLFEGLFAEGVVMVATSNRHPDDLYKNGLNRQLFEPFIDLIKDTLDVQELDSGRDYRLEQLEAAPVYYHPLGSEADSAMDTAFKRLTRGAKAQT